MKLWKRNLIAAAIVLFVCGAVYLNWSYTQDTAAGKNLGQAALVGGREDPLLTQPDPGAADGKSDGKSDGKGEDGQGQDGTQANDPATAESGSYFSTARLNRQQARDNALSLLQEAAKDEKADQTAVDEANASIQTMANATVTEAQIENLITAKGYTDCVAFLGEDSISVVVDTGTGELTAEDVAKITDIAMTETGYPASGIKIMASN